MDEKLKEMIAIGATETANDIPCIRDHFTKALEVGLTDGEIIGAVQVGRMVRKGAMQKWDEEVSVLLSSSPEKQNIT